MVIEKERKRTVTVEGTRTANGGMTDAMALPRIRVAEP